MPVSLSVAQAQLSCAYGRAHWCILAQEVRCRLFVRFELKGVPNLRVLTRALLHLLPCWLSLLWFSYC